jgi:uncharacterized protein with HEPN domain
MMNFIVIGEDVGKLTDDIKTENRKIDWQKISTLRNYDTAMIRDLLY